MQLRTLPPPGADIGGPRPGRASSSIISAPPALDDPHPKRKKRRRGGAECCPAERVLLSPHFLAPRRRQKGRRKEKKKKERGRKWEGKARPRLSPESLQSWLISRVSSYNIIVAKPRVFKRHCRKFNVPMECCGQFREKEGKRGAKKRFIPVGLTLCAGREKGGKREAFAGDPLPALFGDVGFVLKGGGGEKKKKKKKKKGPQRKTAIAISYQGRLRPSRRACDLEENPRTCRSGVGILVGEETTAGEKKLPESAPCGEGEREKKK